MRRRREIGIRRMREGWQAFVKINGKFHSRTFPPDTAVPDMRAWRDAEVAKHADSSSSIAGGSFAADVYAYLRRPEIAARRYVHQVAAHLALWVAALGGDRSRRSITREEIETVLQEWLRTLAEPTVYHRRTALRSLFVTMDGHAGPIEGTTVPAHERPIDRSVPFETLEKILAAMPDDRYISSGIRRPSFAKLRVAVILYTGIPPAELMKLRRHDFDPAAAIVRMPWRDKGAGTPAHIRQLSPEGIEAFRALDAANAWGPFPEEALTHSFKRAARAVCGPDTRIRLYDLRHSLGTDLYRRTRDLATVGRLLGHAPGSTVTARYAMGAHAEVDRAAIEGVAAMRRAEVATPVLPERLKLRAKVARHPKLIRHNKLA